MFKKILLILSLIFMIVLPIFGQTGSLTTNEYFYLPEYGAYGTVEYDEYNTYMEIADLQIEANKDAITNKQPLDAGLTSIAALTTAANKSIYTTSLDTYATYTLTAFARTILDDADASTARGTLGVDLSLYYLKTEMDSFSELQAIISDKTLVNTTDKLNVFASITEAELYGVLSDVSLFLEDTVDDTSPELGGEMDAGPHSIGFTVQTITSSAGTATINWGNSNKARITLSESTELAFTDPANSGNYLLIIIQPSGSNAYTTTFPAGIYWANSTKVSVPTADNNRCIVSFVFDDEDSDKWYCQGTETFATDD